MNDSGLLHQLNQSQCVASCTVVWGKPRADEATRVIYLSTSTTYTDDLLVFVNMQLQLLSIQEIQWRTLVMPHMCITTGKWQHVYTKVHGIQTWRTVYRALSSRQSASDCWVWAELRLKGCFTKIAKKKELSFFFNTLKNLRNQSCLHHSTQKNCRVGEI